SCSPFSDWWAYKWEAADAIPQCAALLSEAGGSTCLKSDSNELMRHMYQEAAKTGKDGGGGEGGGREMVTATGGPAPRAGKGAAARSRWARTPTWRCSTATRSTATRGWR